MFGAHNQVESLTTICSPHLGMKLIDMIHGSIDSAGVQHTQYQHYEHNLSRLYEALGVTAEAAKEFNTPNMENFNEVCEDMPSVDYYSIGAFKNGRTMSNLLKNGYDVLVGDLWGEQCDGIVRDVEARWGRYLMTFENDHMEMMGFAPFHNPANVFNLVADNARVCELKNHPQKKYDYGLDFL